jgi:hypothetical protein
MPKLLTEHMETRKLQRIPISDERPSVDLTANVGGVLRYVLGGEQLKAVAGDAGVTGPAMHDRIAKTELALNVRTLSGTGQIVLNPDPPTLKDARLERIAERIWRVAIAEPPRSVARQLREKAADRVRVAAKAADRARDSQL